MSASEDIFFTILVRIVETRFRLGSVLNGQACAPTRSWKVKVHRDKRHRYEICRRNLLTDSWLNRNFVNLNAGEIILLWSIVNHTKTENKARILRLCFVLYYPFPSPSRVMSDSRTAYGGGPVPMRYLGRKYKSRNRLRMKRSLSKTESETYVNRQKSSTTSVVWIE